MEGSPGAADERSDLLESALAYVDEAVLVTAAAPLDAEHGGPRVVYVNAAFTRLTGYEAGEILGRTPRILQGRRTDRAELDRVRAALERVQPVDCELLNVRKDGSEYWVRLAIRPVLDPAGSPTHWVSVQREVAAPHGSFDDAPVAIAVTSLQGAIVQANPAAVQLLGRAEDELQALTVADLAQPEGRGEAQDLYTRLEAGEHGTTGVELRLVHADGRVLTVLVSASLVPGRAGLPAHVVLHVEDVTERKALEAQLTHQALHDTLTGLPNRALFIDRLAQALGRTRRERSSLAVLFIDLDHFKEINDTLGHSAGDQLLVLFAHRLESLLRPGDSAARLGGDEFTVLCEHSGLQEAMAVADRICAVAAQPFKVDGNRVVVSASVGIAVPGSPYDQPEALLHDADTAMYHAKQRGRAQHVAFDEPMRAASARWRETEAGLHQALAEGELVLHYQPQVQVQTGSIVGIEVLARWNHPQRGLLHPSEFLPVAEETGMIGPLGLWVTEQACRQARAWRDTYGRTPVVWVNLSASQLNPMLVAELRQVLRSTGARPEDIGFEITESVLMDDLATVQPLLTRLRDLGIHLAIDDFGTGYSSLAYLAQLPIDTVKVDRTFTQQIDPPGRGQAVINAVLGLAAALGLQVVVEGVETAAQLEVLRRLPASHAQGFHIARPGPADTLPPLSGFASTG